jgi:hypothetical protein
MRGIRADPAPFFAPPCSTSHGAIIDLLRRGRHESLPAGYRRSRAMSGAAFQLA